MMLMMAISLVRIHVLIDTWWNVNQCICSQKLKQKVVLIDTWWNVNKVKAKVFEEGKAF